MRKYADPHIDSEKANSFEEYRRVIRNPGEHDAAIPSIILIEEAIGQVRWFIASYLEADDSELRPVPLIGSSSSLAGLRSAYLKSLRDRFEYLDLGGFSPKVGNKVVRIRMEDVFVPLKAIENRTLLEEFGEDLGGDAGNADPFRSQIDFAWHMSGRGLEGTLGSGQPNELEIEQLLQQRRIVLLGDPGAGKSTIGRYIALSLADVDARFRSSHNQALLPIVIRASEFGDRLRSEPGLTLFDYFVDSRRTRFGALFASSLLAGSAIVVIDGLDEIADSSIKVLAGRRIEEFVSEYSGNRFVVTSRVVGYRENQLNGGFKEYRLMPFTPQQVLTFLTRWHLAVEQESLIVDSDEPSRRARELVSDIRARPGTRILATNPLLLTIIALASWRGTKLPNRRGELYQLATETLLENWPLRHRRQEFRAEELLTILEPVAFEIFRLGHANAITIHDLHPIVESKICDVQGVTPVEAQHKSRELLSTIAEHTGFFVERGVDNAGQSVFGFLHQTFAEYLAGRHLAELWSSESSAVREFMHANRWHEVVLLMAGHISSWAVNQSSKLLTDIIEMESEFEETIHRDIFLAGAMLADSARASRDVHDKIVSKLFHLALSDTPSSVTSYATNLLVSIGRVTQLGSALAVLDAKESDSLRVQVLKASVSVALDYQLDNSVERIAKLVSLDSATGIQSVDSLEALSRFSEDDVVSSVINYFGDDIQVSIPTSNQIAEILIKCGAASGLTGAKNATGKFHVARKEDIEQAATEDLTAHLFQSTGRERIMAAMLIHMASREEDVAAKLIDIVADNVCDGESVDNALNCLTTLLSDVMLESDELGSIIARLTGIAATTVSPSTRIRLILAEIELVEDESDLSGSLKRLASILYDGSEQSIRLALDVLVRRGALLRKTWAGAAEADSGPSSLLNLVTRLIQSKSSEIRHLAARVLIQSDSVSDATLGSVLNALLFDVPLSGNVSRQLMSMERILRSVSTNAGKSTVEQALIRYITEDTAWNSVDLDKELELGSSRLDWRYRRYRADHLPIQTYLEEPFEELLVSDDVAKRKRGCLLWSHFPGSQVTSERLLMSRNLDAESEAILWNSIEMGSNDSNLISLAIEATINGEGQLSNFAALALRSVTDRVVQHRIALELQSKSAGDELNSAAVSVLWAYYGPTSSRYF